MGNMKKRVLKGLAAALLLGVAAGLTACGTTFTRPSGHGDVEPVSHAYEVGYFKRVSVAGDFDVVYTQDTVCRVTVQAPSDMFARLNIHSVNGTLKVEHRRDMVRSFFGQDGLGDVKVIVSSVDLVEVSIAGSGEFEAPGHVDTDNLRLSVAGSGGITLADVICDSVKAGVAGSGEIDIDNIVTASAVLSIAGSGDIEMGFSSGGDVKCDITGSGDIKLKGTVRSLSTSVAGSGDIYTEELITKSKIH